MVAKGVNRQAPSENDVIVRYAFGGTQDDCPITGQERGGRIFKWVLRGLVCWGDAELLTC